MDEKSCRNANRIRTYEIGATDAEMSLMKITSLREFQLEMILMLKDIDVLFKENSLRYFMLGGGLLGAVRHKGFIPWDDDLDIGIFRCDFERAENLLAAMDGYVYERAEKHIIPNAPVGQLHFVPEGESLENSPTIDVFALDGMPEDERAQRKVYKASNWYCLSVLGRPAYNHGFVIKIVTFLFLHGIPAFFWEKIKFRAFRKISAFDVRTAPFITNLFGAYGKKECVPRHLFDSVCYGEFEGLLVPLPADPDEYLTHIYGNYMELPPAEKRVPHHKKFFAW